ncbi:MAG: EAL domain-containing protein [Bacteroidota bacterium]
MGNKNDASCLMHAPAQPQDLHQATLHLLSLLDSQELEHDLLQQGIETLSALIGVRYGAIALVDDAGNNFQFVHAGIPSEQAEQIGRSPQGYGLLGVVISSKGETLRLDDLAKDPRSAGFPANHPPMKSLLAVPIMRDDHVFGRIYLSEKKSGAAFTDNDEELTQQYADALAFVLAYHRTRTEREREKQILQQVAQAISSVTGGDFFRELVIQLTQTLDTDHAFVGELTEDGTAIQTVANCAHGKIADNFRYRLSGTPCANVVGKNTCFHVTGVRRIFPEDVLLADMQVDSYVGSPLFDSDGKPLGILVMLDSKPLANPEHAEVILRICAARAAAELERQRASNALRESGRSFRAIMEVSPVGIFRTDARGDCLYVNERWCAVAGLTPEQAAGTGWSQALHPEDRESVFALWYKMTNEGLPFRAEYRFQRPDGSVAWLFGQALAERDVSGKIVGYVGSITDITERKKSEEALRASEERFRSLTELSSDWYWEQDSELRFTLVTRNDKTEDVFSVKETLGKTRWELPYLDVSPEFRKMHQALLKARQPFRDLVLKRQDTQGKIRYVSVSGVPIFDAHGDFRGYRGIGRDITERMQSLEALRKSEASLARAQRIARLGNWDWDIVSNELRWSDEIYRIFGLKPEEFAATYDAFLSSVHPDDRQFVVEAVNKALCEKRPYSIDHRIVLPDGTERIVREQAEVTYDENNKAVRMLGTVQDITEERHVQDRLNYLAHYDTLTGLPNRVLLQDRLSQAMVEADRRDRLVALMFLDLDRFKIINDTLGHDVGDALLKSVAERLKSCVRAGDTISRLGGDEFTVVLANVAHVDDVAHVAQKTIESFVSPFHIDGRELFVSPSVGITLYPFDDNDIESLLRNADAAMYHAKELGRNTFQFYTAELNRRTAKRLQLETALRHALERNELLLHYQPQVCLKTGRIIGAEALLRWRHPEMGLISPLEFIPLAEETGLIIPIGEWVLRATCTQARTWYDSGFGDLQIAVNLSGRQFQHQHLARLVKKVLKETGLNPRQLDLELTESLLMHNTDAILGAMEELHAHGVAFSMDDFGTGYSSLSYLKRFPIDTLKIDQSFVRDIPRDPDDAAIAQAIIAMAHNLDIRVIAEGVETAKQLAFLRSKRCDGMQGYYFSEPIPDEAMIRLLQKNRRLKGTPGAARRRSGGGKRRQAAAAKKRARRKTR